jgi:hypothetical protein|tara:strand:- start:352 stop:528 length:177 start_codon:yes stop_codon:yes gene_type:complete
MNNECDENSIDDELMELYSEVFREVLKDLKISRLSGVPIHMLRYDPIEETSGEKDEEE